MEGKHIPTIGLESADFSIKRMEDIEKHRKEDEKPHRHSFFTVLITLQGEGVHVIDFHAYPLSAPSFFFVEPGQVHHVEVRKREVEGYGLFFNPEFLLSAGIRRNLFEDIRLFANCNDNRPIQLEGASLDRVKNHCEEMLSLQTCDDPYQFEAIGALLKLILIEMLRTSRDTGDIHHHEFAATESIIRRFKSTVESDFRATHKVKDIADRLSVSPGYLNEVVKSNIGKTAKDYIQERLLLESKRLAWFSELGSTEVAYRLGFEDPAHFSRFFKKHTGKSFSQWKELTGDFDKYSELFS